MTGTDLSKSARDALKLDIDPANRRIDDEELLIWINEGLNELFSLNPSAFYKDSVVVQSSAPQITSLSDTIQLVEFYKPTMTDYLAYRFFAKDTQDPENRIRSQKFFQYFQQKSGVI